tara:strand:- start:1065 stop:1214 length:150 start_codon:yes stop_codon:yes gene_type:complete
MKKTPRNPRSSKPFRSLEVIQALRSMEETMDKIQEVLKRIERSLENDKT